MGNHPPSGGLLGNRDHNYVVSIGNRATIVFKGREVGEESDGESKESWRMVYNAGTSNCVFILSKMSPNSQHDHKKLVIRINYTSSHGIFNYYLKLQRDGAGLRYTNINDHKGQIILSFFPCGTTNAYGEITERETFIYGVGKRNYGLVVAEWKIKGKDEYPYSANVTHYFVCDEDGVDVGLSVAVKRIRVLPNGALDFVVNGPEMHPADALAYMIRQVDRTKTWKPTDCPHCANKLILERRSDTETDADNAPPDARPPQGRGSGGALVSNLGSYMGKDMGNIYINRFYGRKWW